MNSNPRKRKPDKELRAKIDSRARKALIETGKITSLGDLSEMQKKSPSERRSIIGRRRLESRR